MNTDELKPLWNAYKDQVGNAAHWSEDEILRLIKPTAIAHPWYRSYQHAFLNFCVSFLLLGITSGC